MQYTYQLFVAIRIKLGNSFQFQVSNNKFTVINQTNKLGFCPAISIYSSALWPANEYERLHIYRVLMESRGGVKTTGGGQNIWNTLLYKVITPTNYALNWKL